MATAYLTRIVEFSARHRLGRPGRSDAENQEEFGAAARDHEHRYQCRVTVSGTLVAERGGVVNLGQLDALLAEEIVARFDGRHLNDSPEFADGARIPTGEALSVYIWERLAGRLPPGARLHAVRVQEGPHLYSEYLGEP
jgi:6-pyruvoyl-tetrahydropterin synthase